MASLTNWIQFDVNLPDVLWRGVGMTWMLVMAWVFVVAERDHHPVFTSRNECGTDPQDFLRAGESIEKDTLRFVVDAHCANARYLSDGWIELRYGGGQVDVETKKLNIAGASYYKIVSVGGVAEP